MDRKKFISSALPLAALHMLPASVQASCRTPEEDSGRVTIPPYLVKDDCIGITSPAGHITAEELQPAISKLTEWGFRVKLGSTIGKRDFTFGGTDAERTADLQQLISDDNIKAILCARGGYGAVRIVDALDFTPLRKHPKWLIGFSDITTLHCHINRNVGMATLHSKMCNSFPKDWSLAEPIQIETINSIRQCLAGERMHYMAPFNSNNRLGEATGELVGGNLKTIESLAGSNSDLQTNRKILFVEDTGEYLYSIDRMFWNLKRSGKLDQLTALIIGGFKIKKDDAEADAFGKTLEQIVLEKVQEYNYPVCFDFPVGHQKNNYALKCGVKHRLVVNADASILVDSAIN